MYTAINMFKSVMALVLAITLFACESNYQNVKKMSLSDGAPVAEGKDINFKYTDSGKLVTNLLAPKLLDYSNLEFPFKEFPNGIEVRFWDEKGKKNTVTADYAIQFDNTGLVDLQDNVVVITADSVVLKANQLYWDQKNKWVFTDQPYQIKFKDGSYNDGAVGFDSSEDFTTFLSRKNQGVQLVDKTKKEDAN
ncbi:MULTISPECIES: LPS export ABC transporter periplasmic protein LptC [Aequorivita]|uniref:LPS export ABC transporter periplasmic protein LptC n=1 Tax=Aequorivita iocasae TaxID=2803865 RepID=A0ABX7DU86_9FLAO|nr:MULTISPECIES: LPS export ABC transporter periplasmic protein LptC [Aequorivita]QQX77123.1 LPS export ABC transporter periplasmic protein LptC [Aequorivita iocasae]UCA56609.1 LPS export ABC transporter periplasmic protein LptC [Aequorivita sp. F7]